MTRRETPSFIAVGELMVDVVAEGRGHDSRITIAPGGSAATAAVWAAALGAASAVVGRIGADQPGRMLRAALWERGVAALLTEDPEAPTGTFLLLRDGGERRIIVDRGANAGFDPNGLPDPLVADAVLVSGFLLLHGASEAGARSALARAEAPLVAVDAASRSLLEACGRERFLERTRAASTLLANEEEARFLTGGPADEAARALGERFRLACVKRGPAGAVAVLDGEVVSAGQDEPAEDDAIGAGDAFAAALLVGLARGSPLAEALEEACGAGGAAARTRWPAPGVLAAPDSGAPP